MNHMTQKTVNHFVFNPEDNGGEAVSLITIKHTDTRTNESFYTQEVCLQSYGNSASFAIVCYITPEKLRELANQLEKAID